MHRFGEWGRLGGPRIISPSKGSHWTFSTVTDERSIGHDWVSDEFSRQTWPMLKPNQLTRYLRELQRPEDCVFLAGSDYANGWMGFIDGAIESGLKVSREVNEHLSAQA